MVYVMVNIGDVYMEEKCENCKFWSIKKEDSTSGFCKRYPTYVERSFNDYCGEFTPKIKSELLQE